MKHHLAEKAATAKPGRARQGTISARSETQRGATRHPILRLQGTIGNQAVNRLLRSGRLQTKLTVSRPGDTPVQRQESDEEELLQSSGEAIQRQTGTFTAPPAHRPNRTDLPDHLKSGIESLSGFSMDDVTVHYNSAQPAQLNALAYTQGTEIHIASGQEQHLPHEAWHVVQQAQRRVQPTMQLKDGVPVNDDQGLEHEADVMGAKAMQMRQTEGAMQGVGDEVGRVVQRSGEMEEASQSQEEAIATTGAKGRLNFLSIPSEQKIIDPELRNGQQWVAPLQRQEPSIQKTNAASGVVLQRLLNDGEKGPLEARCLNLENRIETAIRQLPAIMRMNKDHPLIEKIRAKLVQVRAAYGVDDRMEITDTLNKYENTIVALEGNINNNLVSIQEVARVWNIFAGRLGALAEKLQEIRKQIYNAGIVPGALSAFERLIQRTISMSKQDMQKLRETNRDDAVNLVTHYVTAGYIVIEQLNTFYASSYDSARDDFGASAPLKSNASSGSFQWLRDFEYHIHAAVVRGGTPINPVTGFTIKTGHIKPSDEAKTTGLSITVPAALNNTVIANSTQKVIRWANSKKGEEILRKQ